MDPGKNVGELPPKDLLKKLKISNPNNLIVGHLNINSIRYKYECLNDIIDKNVDILLISETKLNDSFPTVHFFIFRKMYLAERFWLPLNQTLRLFL